MRLSDLQHKDIVDLNGNRLGNIIDVKLDTDGKMVSLIIEPKKNMFRISSKGLESEITWDKIEKIGEDVILVKV